MDAITTPEAAAVLGVSVERVSQLVRAGRLSARRAGRVWLIDRASLRAFRRLPPGRPKKNPKKSKNCA